MPAANRLQEDILLEIVESNTEMRALARNRESTDTSAVVLLEMVAVDCCLCGPSDSSPIASGEDFEYRTSANEFTVYECLNCESVYLNPRPDASELPRIYPDSYHAFEFSESEYGLVYKVRRRLEANRLLSWCAGIPADAKILDIGCGDGFHLDLLGEFGKSGWELRGVDIDERAVSICNEKGLDVHHGTLSTSGFKPDSFDFAYTLQTVEHVARPAEFLGEINGLLKPGGILVVVTDNTGSPDFKLFKKRYWGGYHFPRHWNLFNKKNIKKLAKIAGFETEIVSTQVSPVNWTYSLRNLLEDKGYPSWIVERFSLKSTVSLSMFTAFDTLFRLFGKGALLNVRLVKPAPGNQ